MRKPDQCERKTGIQHNQLKVYKEINYSGNCANMKDNILVDDDVMEEGEDYEMANRHYQHPINGKFKSFKILLGLN